MINHELMSLKFYSIFFSIILILASCSGHNETQLPEHIANIKNLEVFELPEDALLSISFNREISFGSDDEILIGRISSIATDQKANVYIADNEQKTIHLFDEAGTYIQSIGQEGKGPGEFMGIVNLNINPPYIYAHDYRQDRLNLFDLETRTFVKAIKLRSENTTIDIPPRFNPSGYKIIPNSDLLLIPFTQSVSIDQINKERHSLYFKMDLQGNYHPKSVLETKSADYLADRSGDSYMVMSSPFGRKPFTDISSTGTIYTAWSEDFLLYRYNLSGDQLGAWYYSDFKKTSLSQKEALSQRENSETYQRIVKNMDLPKAWPAFDDLLIDDKDRLWIATIVKNKSIYKWWVLDIDGTPLATFTWPRARSIEVIKNGKAYVKETDESDLSTIVRYNIEGFN